MQIDDVWLAMELDGFITHGDSSRKWAMGTCHMSAPCWNLPFISPLQRYLVTFHFLTFQCYLLLLILLTICLAIWLIAFPLVYICRILPLKDNSWRLTCLWSSLQCYRRKKKWRNQHKWKSNLSIPGCSWWLIQCTFIDASCILYFTW